jgi:hypothetical protein
MELLRPNALPEHARELVLGGNASRLFKLEEKS